MSDFLNSDLIEFDNDASASSFGWNFQSNAGIFLFLHYIDNAENLVIESKLQDIEITLRNQEKILAQAKSSQEPSNDKAKKEKFKDAIISIAKTSKKEPNAHFIYISNEPNTFDSANRAFDNKVRSYDECLTAIKTEIDSVIEATIKSLNAKIQKLEQKKNQKKRTEKIITVKRNLKKFATCCLQLKKRICLFLVYLSFGAPKKIDMMM